MTVWAINQKFRALPDRAAASPPTDRQTSVAEMFGIGLDESYEVTLYDGLRLDVRPGDVVFITGPSGGGKSVLVRRLGEALRDAASTAGGVVDLAAFDLPTDRPVIELMDAPLEEALRTLSTAGLADAFLLLRTADQLSDGQRYRLRLARAIERLRQVPAPPDAWRVLVADEFCSTLDRLCARAVAYRVRRLATQEGLTVLAASAHDDLVEDLAPDVLVTKQAGRQVEVDYADASRGGRAP